MHLLLPLFPKSMRPRKRGVKWFLIIPRGIMSIIKAFFYLVTFHIGVLMNKLHNGLLPPALLSLFEKINHVDTYIKHG